MPRRVLMLLTVICACAGLTFGLAACGGSDDSSSDNTTSDTVQLTDKPSNPENGSNAGTPSDSAGGTDRSSESAAGGAGENASAGKAIFTQSCASCHTLADAGASGSVGPNLDDLKPDAATVARQVANGGGGMPSFTGTLQPDQIREVAAYVAGAAGS
ncbi:MAG TPA: cytochrome c [Conexibacter sp.]|jgi:mono/diheme cytochrome c family protein